MRLQGRVAVVTGGSLGIGRATVLGLAREGAAVALAGRDEERGGAATKEVEAQGGEALFVRTDVSHENEVAALMERVRERWGRLDVLVNNAGIHLAGGVVATSLDDWRRVLDVNLTGAFLCTKHAVPLMVRAGGGVIVNVSSEAGLVGIAEQVAYNVSKAGLIGLTRSCAVDLADHGIRVNCVCPGTTETPLVDEAVGRTPDPTAARRNLAERRPLGRLGTPDEIASAIVYLASDEAAYATGAVLSVDGGYTAQ